MARPAEQREESHGAPAADSQSLSPAPCSHAATYRRPSGVLVCLDCAATLAPGDPEWQPQTIMSCEPGQHIPYPDTPADQPRQCMKCPYVWDTTAAGRPRDSAVHDPHCAGMGLVVVPSWGWSCPQCNRRYVVPEIPAPSTPAQAAWLKALGQVQHMYAGVWRPGDWDVIEQRLLR